MCAGFLTGELLQDCSKCQGEPELKELWGCLADAEAPVFAMECDRCAGAGCAECSGTGHWESRRCPVPYLEGTDELILAYLHYQDGFLPEDGGTDAQPAHLLRGVLALGSEIKKIEAARMNRGLN